MDHHLVCTIAGYLSLGCWIIVFTPQLWENYSRKSGDGLSMSFLLIWLVGDIFNLLGVIMQDLLVTMFLLALYYTLADICLIWQVIYYQENGSLETSPLLSSKKPRKSKLLHVSFSLVIIFITVISCGVYMKNHGDQNGIAGDEMQFLPQCMGWISAVFYIGSRIPQIIKNWKQKSTEGLSFGMFLFAVLGNVLFTLSIFSESTDKNYLLINLPWIVGSCGTFLFDFTIFTQFFLYRHNKISIV